MRIVHQLSDNVQDVVSMVCTCIQSISEKGFYSSLYICDINLDAQKKAQLTLNNMVLKLVNKERLPRKNYSFILQSKFLVKIISVKLQLAY